METNTAITFDQLLAQGEDMYLKEVQKALEIGKAEEERINGLRLSAQAALMEEVVKVNLPECLWQYVYTDETERITSETNHNIMLTINAPQCAPIKFRVWLTWLAKYARFSAQAENNYIVSGLRAAPPTDEDPDYIINYSDLLNCGAIATEDIAYAIGRAHACWEQSEALKSCYEEKAAQIIERNKASLLEQARRCNDELLSEAQLAADMGEIGEEYDPLTRLRCALEDLVTEVLDAQLAKRGL